VKKVVSSETKNEVCEAYRCKCTTPKKSVIKIIKSTNFEQDFQVVDFAIHFFQFRPVSKTIVLRDNYLGVSVSNDKNTVISII